MNASTKILLGVSIAGVILGGTYATIRYYARNLGSTETFVYKGYEITVTCGGLGGSECVAGWSLHLNGAVYSDQIVNAATAAAAFSQAQAKIDAYSHGETT
jgi:hypothetical protein